MHEIVTRIRAVHKELVEIFFKANEFKDARVINHVEPENYGDQEMLKIFYSDEDASLIVFMGFRHGGILNMLDDYLIKCGAYPSALHVTEVLSTAKALEIVKKMKEHEHEYIDK